MKATLAQVPPQPRVFISTNPATGRELSRTEPISGEAVEQALARAEADQLRWRNVPLAERAAFLLELARQVELAQKDLAALMSREVGKPFREALGELRKCAWTARHFAEQGPAILADESVPTDAKKSFVSHRPLGIVLAIMPWNFPFWQVFRFAVPAVLAGNVVLLKHAPMTMGCSAAIEGIFRKAGAARGILQHLPVEVDEVPRLVADARVRAVTVTGSTRAGRAVAALCGQHLKPCVLELGGSDPFIVMPSADLDLAVESAVLARIQNNGQSCIAAKRFIVHDAVAQPFEDRFVAAMSRLKVGDPMDESVQIGPLASQRARETLHDQVVRSIAAGASLLLGGKALGGPGYFYAPTVLGDVPDAAPAATEELFGPVAALFRVASLSEALAVANRTSYGLSASIWTQTEAEAAEAVTHIEAGSVFVNGMPKSDPRLPFGGVKESGYGRELGREGLLAFTSAKTVWIR
jgi:succinate-semialdehyde dehydrogenase/glutarate-semialdehyde dehydrogenase